MIKTMLGRVGSMGDPILLSILGVLFLVTAAFLWSVIAGFVAAGVGCFLLELRVDQLLKEKRAPGQ